MNEADRVLTDGHRLYVRGPRLYHEVNRRGERIGVAVAEFTPPPVWRRAGRCEPEPHTLTCKFCGRYDQPYAETGERSYCAKAP